MKANVKIDCVDVTGLAQITPSYWIEKENAGLTVVLQRCHGTALCRGLVNRQRCQRRGVASLEMNRN